MTTQLITKISEGLFVCVCLGSIKFELLLCTCVNCLRLCVLTLHSLMTKTCVGISLKTMKERTQFVIFALKRWQGHCGERLFVMAEQLVALALIVGGRRSV